jgi:hypothetical protein
MPVRKEAHQRHQQDHGKADALLIAQCGRRRLIRGREAA